LAYFLLAQLVLLQGIRNERSVLAYQNLHSAEIRALPIQGTHLAVQVIPLILQADVIRYEDSYHGCHQGKYRRGDTPPLPPSLGADNVSGIFHKLNRRSYDSQPILIDGVELLRGPTPTPPPGSPR